MPKGPVNMETSNRKSWTAAVLAVAVGLIIARVLKVRHDTVKNTIANLR
jgi:hypothetical protein